MHFKAPRSLGATREGLHWHFPSSPVCLSAPISFVYQVSILQVYSSNKIHFSSSSSSKQLISLDTPVKKSDINSAPATRNASIKAAVDIEIMLKKLPLKYLKKSSLVLSEVGKLLKYLHPSVGTSTQLWPVAKEVSFVQ